MSNEIEQTYTKYDEDDDYIDDTFDATRDDSSLSHGSSEQPYAVPKRCRAIYDFQVCLNENENLSVNLVTSLLQLLIMILFLCGIISLKEFVSNGKDSTQVSNTDLL